MDRNQYSSFVDDGRIEVAKKKLRTEIVDVCVLQSNRKRWQQAKEKLISAQI